MKGVVGIVNYADDGKNLISVADFDQSSYGGYSVEEAQKLRVKRDLAFAVARALCSPLFVDAMSSHQCEDIFNNMIKKGVLTRTIIPINHEE